jgi:hypothetical protein
MGASLSALSQFLVDYRDWVRQVGGVIIIVFGLYLAGVLRLTWLGRTQQIQVRSKPAGLVGSCLVGVTFAVGWTPCVGPILGSILSLAGTGDTVSTGVTLLAVYSAGLALPFLLSSLALGAFLASARRFRPWIRRPADRGVQGPCASSRERGRSQSLEKPCRRHALGAADPAAGELAPPSTPLALFDGGTLDLRTLQGQVVVIRFLASW